MLGFGMHFHTMEGIETPLYARAFVFKEPYTGKKMVLVIAEIGFVTNALKQGVLWELDNKLPNHAIDDSNLILAAQHTHSGPGGFAYYGIYNVSIPGFVKEVFHKLTEGIADAIVEAHENTTECNIAYNEGVFDLSDNVAFNRSLKQYNQNPEVQPKIDQRTANTGVDRKMYQLSFHNNKNEIEGLVNWFGVHTTSVSNDLNKVCADNKGYAAMFTEQQFNETFIAAFAQGSCGDITPRFKYNSKRKYQRGNWDGEYEDDYKSAAFNGKLQSNKSIAISSTTDSSHFLKQIQLDSEIFFFDFSNVACNPKYTNGVGDARTSPAAMGIDFLGGAYVDGPGMHPALVFVVRRLIRLRRLKETLFAKLKSDEKSKKTLANFRSQGVKDIAVETNERRLLGIKNVSKSILPGWLDPGIELFKIFHEREGYKNKPWSGKILPIQLSFIGEVALAAFPFEITTIAAKRLKQSLLEKLKPLGKTTVILVPYANGYSGYVTTFEEYQVQMYEGGHTVFGQWTLAALQTKFDELVDMMSVAKENRQLKHDDIPPSFSIEELNSFAHYTPNWYKRKLKRESKLEK